MRGAAHGSQNALPTHRAAGGAEQIALRQGGKVVPPPYHRALRGRCDCLSSDLEDIMRAVAERLIVRRLAPANVECPGPVGNERQWLNSGAFMRAVAERLRLRAAAAAIPVFLAFRQLDLVRSLLSDECVFRHLKPLIAEDCWPLAIGFASG